MVLICLQDELLSVHLSNSVLEEVIFESPLSDLLLLFVHPELDQFKFGNVLVNLGEVILQDFLVGLRCLLVTLVDHLHVKLS